MTRWLTPFVFLLAACGKEVPVASKPADSSTPAPPSAAAGPWINTTDQSSLDEKLAAAKGKNAVWLEFSFLA